MKTSQIIYTIEKRILDKLVLEFTNYMTNPYHEWRQSSKYEMDMFDYELGCADAPTAEERGLRYNFQGEVITQNLRKKLPKQETLSAHFISLIDTIYRRSFSTDDARFRLNAETLKKLYGDIYPYMIKALCKLDLFSGSFYHGFFIPDYKVFRREQTFNSKVINDIERNKKISQDWLSLNKHLAEEAITERMTNELGYSHKEAERFIKRYNNNISKLRLVDKVSAVNYLQSDNFRTFINQKGKDLQRSQNYYYNIIDELSVKKNHCLSAPDENGRYYHIGTRLPRSIRQYTNIKYTLDCANSHLLLFNFFIYDYYIFRNINIDYTFNNQYNLFYLLSLYIHNNTYTTDFRKKLHNYLSVNNIDDSIISKIKLIPKDAWLYMHRSSHGLLWDDFMEEFNQSDRNELKRTMFASVFYTNRTRFKTDNEYAVAFKTKYPSVLRVINYYKRLCKSQCKERGLLKTKRSSGQVKSAIQLPHLMMRLESRIFTDILSLLFAKRINAIGIHDAIAVIGSSETSPQQVREVMLKTYRYYGLLPTLSDK